MRVNFFTAAFTQQPIAYPDTQLMTLFKILRPIDIGI